MKSEPDVDESTNSSSSSTRTASATEHENLLPTPALSPITEHGSFALLASSPEAIRSKDDGDDCVKRTQAVRDKDDHTEKPSTPRMQQHDDENWERRPSNGMLPSPAKTDRAQMPESITARTLKLSPAKIFELTSSPGSLPVRAASPIPEEIPPYSLSDVSSKPSSQANGLGIIAKASMSPKHESDMPTVNGILAPSAIGRANAGATTSARPVNNARSNSSPIIRRKQSLAAATRTSNDNRDQSAARSRRPTLASLKTGEPSVGPGSSPGYDPVKNAQFPDAMSGGPSSIPSVLPLPPLSLPTYLQLELSSERPSALYIHRSANAEIPYESSKLKFERLVNFLVLPYELEQVLCFGAVACLDAWLYTFTILPLRFCKATAIWLRWWVQFVVTEVTDILAFIYRGIGRLWQRQRRASTAPPSRNASVSDDPATHPVGEPDAPARAETAVDESMPREQQRQVRRDRKSSTRHRRTKSVPSALMPNHKADLLQGLLIIFSCMILLKFDASRIYHNIRGQSVIKLYVIYNSLEICDRLFSALGQDILECLFSKETLERKPNGRSKIIRPLWMFALALIYNVIHAAALFYQVITLNVAVNSYSNALLTLLMSNQFVEIKGSVFKKLEKENLFQMTCADVVERFQLWLMLLIIALRNIVEIGGLSINFSGSLGPTSSSSTATAPGMLPKAFTWLPNWSGQVILPFLVVLGSEMVVDWLKHAYINKFNSIKPNIYGRYLDVLAKDYYTHAFVDQNLMKRLGLPVLPLACLFIRASVQTYHMFLATHMPLPIPSPATALAVESASAESSPATTAALAHIDQVFRRALGRSSFGAGAGAASAFSWWSLDDVIAFATMLVFFLVMYFILLALKLVLGMCLLSVAQSRYKGMRERERECYDTGGRRLGGWGSVEVGEEKRRWIYEDDEEGLRGLRERESRAKEKAGKGELKLDGIQRYMMAAKRVW